MRWRRSALPIVQAAVAAGLAWLIAAHIVGHRSPFFAPIAAVIALGFTLDQRLRRAIELIVGVSLGVGVGDLFISVIGTGPWQIALVVALAMSIAALIDGGAVITVQAAVSAILVAMLYLPGEMTGVTRMVDALIGGATALAVVTLFPRIWGPPRDAASPGCRGAEQRRCYGSPRCAPSQSDGSKLANDRAIRELDDAGVERVSAYAPRSRESRA